MGTDHLSVGYFCTAVNYTVIVDVSALKVHMSKNAHNALKAFPEFLTEPRGEMCIKVK